MSEVKAAEDLVRVLTKQRRCRPHSSGADGAESERVGELADEAELRVLHSLHQPRSSGLWMLKELLKVENGSGRHALVHEDLRPVVRRGRGEALVQPRADLLPVRRPARVVGEARVAQQVLGAQDLAEPNPVGLGAGRDVHLRVGCAEGAVRENYRVVVAHPVRHLAQAEVALALDAEEADEARQKGSVHHLPAACAVPVV
mmetsp:Transcript_98722/g.279621  ORF Transcript_98722/g.279621 Transcript_98722/m.279621 type:complete len:201 (+) Transcript_98722:268-870(+)